MPDVVIHYARTVLCAKKRMACASSRTSAHLGWCGPVQSQPHYYYYYFKTLVFFRERYTSFACNMDELGSKMFRFQILTFFPLAMEPTRKELTAVTLVTDVPGTYNG